MQERRVRSVFAKIRPGNRKCGVSRFLMCKYTEFQKKTILPANSGSRLSVQTARTTKKVEF